MIILFLFYPFQHKLYIQKLRAFILFENKTNHDVVNNIIRTIAAYSKENLKEVIEDKFVVDFLLSKMDSSTVSNMGEHFLKMFEKKNCSNIPQHILNSTLLLNAVNMATLSKINKIVSKQKKKHVEDGTLELQSVKVFSAMSKDLFLNENSSHEASSKIKYVFEATNDMEPTNFVLNINEDKVCGLLRIAKHFPIVFSHADTQKCFLYYLLSLHKDFADEFSKTKFKMLQNDLENLIIGKLTNFF